MALLIGTDEAGYGPNLGPLTICGTAWEVPDSGLDLYDTLQRVVSRSRERDGRLTICDSKSIYTSAGSLRNLESSVMAILVAIGGSVPRSVRRLQSMLHCELEFAPPKMFAPFFEGLTLPVAAAVESVAALGERFRLECAKRDVRLAEVKCEAIFPHCFNELILRYGNKAELLSATTLQMVADWSRSHTGPIRIVCDKHGGRSRYAAMISHFLTDGLVTAQCESARISRYVWPSDAAEGDRVQQEIAFLAGGESFLPTALASMIAKYVRELSMIVWNRFWLDQIPGIKPTQGYPADAKRFLAEITETQLRLGIANESIWRLR